MQARTKHSTILILHACGIMMLHMESITALLCKGLWTLWLHVLTAVK